MEAATITLLYKSMACNAKCRLCPPQIPPRLKRHGIPALLSTALTMAGIGISDVVVADGKAGKDAVPRILFTNVHVFDGKSEKRVMNASVVVEGNLIKSVSTKPLEADGATVIDGGGCTLTPGLMDTHVHMQLVVAAPDLEFLPQQDVAIKMVPIAEDMLMRGFTTVRDACGNTHGLRRQINEGVVIGPRIFSAGACIGRWSSHADFMTATSVKGQTNVERMGFSTIADGPHASPCPNRVASSALALWIS